MVANFSASSVKGCSPVSIQFRDLSTGNPTSWFWDFGNHTTSSLQNPTAVYTTSGTYNVRLIVRNSGSSDYEEKQNFITVLQTPEPQFIPVIDSGCAPLPVTFTNTTNLSNIQIQSWSWDFGDGTTDVAQNPTHTFSAKGVYTVSLTAKTIDGCTSTFTMPSAIRTGNHTQPDFTASPLDGCASQLRDFTNTSSGNITSYSWGFGDKGSSVVKDPSYHYQDTGWFSVKLVSADNGCKDSIEKRRLIHVDGPVALMYAEIFCDDRMKVKFSDKSIAEDTRKWNFGDGKFSTVRIETHIYSSPGVYNAKLKVDGNKCSDTASRVINIATKKPVIVAAPQKTAYCRGDSILFTFADYDTSYIRSFAWSFGDDSTTPYKSDFDSINYVYPKNGNYKLVGYLRDNERCIDTITLNPPVAVTGPVANFNFSRPGCINAPVNFEDSSIEHNGNRITSWSWNFDDGTEKNTSAPGHVYSFPLIYDVKLKVEDSKGCTDSVYLPVKVAQVPVVNAGKDTFLCAGQFATLNASGAINYTWTSANTMSCGNCRTTRVKPTETTMYYVTGTNDAGCASQDSILITVQQKQHVKISSASASLCAGDPIQLQATGSYAYVWSPSTCMDNCHAANPIARPMSSTTFMVTGKDQYACFTDTATLNLSVVAKPVVSLTDSIVQLLSGSSYQVQSNSSADVQSWQWLPATGLSCYNCATPVITVNDNVSYTVSVTNAAGCTNNDEITFVSLCKQEVLFMPNTFSPNRDGMNDYFFPRSNKNILVKSLKIYNRWGQAVFAKANFPANNGTYGWDGKFNNTDQQSDVYVYVMEVECSNGKTVLKKGDVSLLR